MTRLCTLASVAFSVLAASFPALAQHSMKPMSDDQAIRSAMAAAPPAVARNATIVTVNEKGELRTLRKGSNNFTCIADDPSTPGPDPMCMDANGVEWWQAFLAHKDPPQKVGFIYMLRGGTDASNTDPFAAKPEPNNNWIETGAHVMVVGVNKDTMPGYPRLPKPDTSQPYVMLAGTPYEHLMIPVQSSQAARQARR